MSGRSGYSTDLDDFALGRWRGVVASAMRGRRGQKFLRELVMALDAMPEKKLIANVAEDKEGAVCALAALARARELDLTELDSMMRNEDYSGIGDLLDIAPALTQEVMYENDEPGYRDDAERWLRMRQWATGHIKGAA